MPEDDGLALRRKLGCEWKYKKEKDGKKSNCNGSQKKV